VDVEPQQSYLAPEPPAATPRQRARTLVTLAAAALGVLAVCALAISNGGSGVANESIDSDLGMSGLQAPGSGAGAKALGGLKPGEKIVGAPAGKAAVTTSIAPSTTLAPSLATARKSTTSAATGTAPTTAPATSAAPTATAPTTAPPVTAPPTTAAPRANPAGGGSAWTPTGPVYWLATDGNDGNDGSEGSPWRNFASVLYRLHPGDTLLVKAGTYGNTSTGPAINIEGVNGTSAAPITIAAAPGQQVNILGGGWQVLRVSGSSYVDVRGFDVSGSAASEHSTSNGIEVNGAHHVRIVANTVHDVGGGGISGVGANHVTIDSNRIYNTAMWNGNQSSAISLFESANIGGGNNGDGFSFYVRNNVVYNNKNLVGAVTDGNCIIVDSNRHTGYSGGTYVGNNLCYANGGRGVHVFISDNVLAVNNTLVGNLTSGEMSDQGELSAIQATNVSFRNNLVVPYRDGNGAREYASSGVSYSNNLYVGSAPGPRVASDLVVGDARLGGDYVPLAGSPAIDAGTSDGAPSTDRRGRVRTGAPDIGAYES
jgi:hypothetical protein